jgi:hypothetical protein
VCGAVRQAALAFSPQRPVSQVGPVGLGSPTTTAWTYEALDALSTTFATMPGGNWSLKWDDSKVVLIMRSPEEQSGAGQAGRFGRCLTKRASAAGHGGPATYPNHSGGRPPWTASSKRWLGWARQLRLTEARSTRTGGHPRETDEPPSAHPSPWTPGLGPSGYPQRRPPRGQFHPR